MFLSGTTIATAHYGPEKASYGTGAMYVICDMIKRPEIAEDSVVHRRYGKLKRGAMPEEDKHNKHVAK